MNKHTQFTLTLLLLVSLLISSCQEEETPVYDLSGAITNTTQIAVGQAEVRLLAADGTAVATTTTDADGNYSLAGLVAGDYTLRLDGDGYQTTEYAVSISQETAYDAVLRGGGSIDGQVVNSQTGTGLAGVKVLYMPSTYTVPNSRMAAPAITINDIDESAALMVFVTDASGAYRGIDIPVGTFTIVYVRDEFDIRVADAVVEFGNNEFDPVTLVELPKEGEIRIVLSWGEFPADLDAHLTGPTATSDRFHIYFADPQYIGAAGDTVFLDVDDLVSYGPETITIKSLISGSYQYSVHNYTERGISNASQSIRASPARVEVYDGTGLIAEYDAPQESPGDIWRVFRLNVSGENYSIEDVDEYLLRSYALDNYGFRTTGGKQELSPTNF